MKMKQFFCTTLALAALSSALTVGASAADYSFGGAAEAEYYTPTSYESVYGAQYNYGGVNVSDYEVSALPYGVVSTASIGAMEKVRLPGASAPIESTGYGVTGIPVEPIGGYYTPSPDPGIVYQIPAYTGAKDMECSDGSIGTLKIPVLDINMKVWEGETDTSMAKGLGHYSATSGWDGNVGVCGHNRGARYVIGSIKDLNIGDRITYTTVYGTRTYEVSLVEVISSTDWTYLQATADNRITITTCLANQPTKRVCVQALQIV